MYVNRISTVLRRRIKDLTELRRVQHVDLLIKYPKESLSAKEHNRS
jgi:hypothetical protein